jgi:hypothetical protein
MSIDRRHRRRRQSPGPGHDHHHQDPAHARHHLALIVVAGEDRYAIPQIAVRELVRAKAGDDNRIERSTRRSCGCAGACCRSCRRA